MEESGADGGAALAWARQRMNHPASSPRRPWGRRALAFLLATLALFATHLAWREWRTHLFEERLLALEVNNRERLGEVLQRLEHAAPLPEVAGDSATRLELRARWWLVWAERSAGAKNRRMLWQRARDELRSAVSRRPVSAFAWANLAAVKSQLGSIDAEFATAFARALRLGPHELRVQRQLLGILLRHPERAPALLEREGRQLARRLDRRDPYRLIALSSRYDALPWLCVDEELGATIRAFCREQGYSSSATSSSAIPFSNDLRL